MAYLSWHLPPKEGTEISSEIPGTWRGLSGAGLTSWAAAYPGLAQGRKRWLRVTQLTEVRMECTSPDKETMHVGNYLWLPD